MLTALILLTIAVVALVPLLLAIVVAAIRSEPADERLCSRAPDPLSAIVRRLLGVYVRRPGDSGASREACLAGHAGTAPDDGER